jgi:hypothetical protein
MSVHVSWIDDTHTAILREFEGSWTWDEFYASQDEVNSKLRSVTHLVHQVLDFSQTKSLPPNTLTHLRNSGRNMPDNRGKSLVVTQSMFYLQMYRVLDRMFPALTKRVVIVATREAALEKIRPAEARA